jgi:hypothetical protein
MNRHFFRALATIFLAAPVAALAAAAGTNGHLREIGYSDAQLSTEATTENREAFKLAEGAGRVEDPLGDVLDRFGVTSGILQPWGDIERATLLKNDEAQAWDLTVTLGGALPDAPTYQAQFYLYMDIDGDAANNDPQGVRVGTDAEFSVRYGAEKGWFADYRWYNKDADFWAMNKETASTFERNGNQLVLHVPFAEARADLAPYWRAAVAVADGPKTQIDVAPGTGFPPPLGETYPADNVRSNLFTPRTTLLAVSLAVAAAAGLTLAKKRRNG